MTDFTGDLSDFEQFEAVTIPKDYYDRLLAIAKLSAERLEKKDALYAVDKDLDMAMHKLKPYAAVKK